jgi:FtsP/CotA-like multicopper oxidase with cupredoxin domain
MRPTPFVIVAAVILAFIAVGGYLIFGRGGIGTGKPITVNVSVTGTRMNPSSTISVHQGDQVTMNVTVDKKEEIHLHGYDIKFEAAKAGETVTHKFTADKTGNFDIEIEDTGTVIGSMVVRPGSSLYGSA